VSWLATGRAVRNIQYLPGF